MPEVSVASLHALPQDDSMNWLDLTAVTNSLVNWGCQVATSLFANTRFVVAICTDPFCCIVSRILNFLFCDMK